MVRLEIFVDKYNVLSSITLQKLWPAWTEAAGSDYFRCDDAWNRRAFLCPENQAKQVMEPYSTHSTVCPSSRRRSGERHWSWCRSVCDKPFQCKILEKVVYRLIKENRTWKNIIVPYSVHSKVENGTVSTKKIRNSWIRWWNHRKEYHKPWLIRWTIEQWPGL